MDARFALAFLVAVLGRVSAQHDHHQHDMSNHEEHRVNVTVYYESLCPDSRKFFNQQLYPSLQNANLSQLVNLTLVPYGKTKTKMVLSELQFECHHGPGECRGNKIQACALQLIQQDDPGLGFNRVATGFINCLMAKVDNQGEATVFPTTECARINNVNNLNLIENCANHTDSSNYLSRLGQQTAALQPPLKGVPTIVFNGQYKDEDNSLAQNNFVKALCQYIQDPKPEDCSKNGGSRLLGTFLVALAAVMSRLLF